MKVRVKLFAAAKDLAGSDEITVELGSPATIAEVRGAVLAAQPTLASVLAHSLWAVDTQYALENTPVTEQSEVALIPPVSGG